MKKKIIVLQDGSSECGAACLLSIIRYFEGNYPMSRLLELTNTDKSGTNFYNLKKASEDIGFSTTAYKLESLDYLKIIVPSILCHIIESNNQHFVVIYKIYKNKIILMDPACGERVVDIRCFNNIWTGNVLKLTPIKKINIYNESKFLNKLIKKTIISNLKLIFKVLLHSFIYIISTIIFSLYIQIIIDNKNKINSMFLVSITLIYIIILFIKCLSNYVRNRLLIKAQTI